NLGAIAYYLMHRDISEFNPDAPPPVTEDKLRLIEVSRLPIEQEVRDMIERGEEPFGESDLVRPPDIRAVLHERGFHKSTDPEIRQVLRRCGFRPVDKDKKGMLGGRRSSLRPWARRNFEKWE